MVPKNFCEQQAVWLGFHGKFQGNVEIDIISEGLFLDLNK